MRFLIGVCAVTLACAACARDLHAAEQPAQVRVESADGGGPGTSAPAVPLTPMAAEILAAVEASRAEVAELASRIRMPGNDAEALVLAREIRRAKLEGRLAVLRIQLRYAQAEGRDAAAARLQAAIDRMTAPPRTGQPIPRPVGQRPDGR